MTEYPEHVISYPFGNVDAKVIDYSATINIEVENQKTIVAIGELSGALTLTAEASAELKVGAELIVKLKSDGTARDTTLSTGFEGTTVAGVISKTKVACFVYDGTNFVHISTNQVD
jgi:hypothetical protein